MQASNEKKRLSECAERIVGQSMFRMLAIAEGLEREGKNIIHLEIGDTYLEMPEEVKERAIKSLREERTHYGPSHGEHELRRAICKAFKEDFGFLPSIKQTVIASGANPLIFYLM